MKISNFSSETTGPFVTKYYIERSGAEKLIFVQMVEVK